MNMSSSKVGSRIRTFRERLNLTLVDLAERSGVDVDQLNAIEENELYPSLGPLVKISRALGQRLGTFLDDQIQSDPLIIKKDQQDSEFVMHKSRDHAATYQYHSLGKGKNDRHMEPFFIEIYPEDGNENELSTHEGEEFIVVVSGQVQLKYGTETYTLNPGDSMYYNSVIPHHVGAVGGKAEVYAVVYLPME